MKVMDYLKKAADKVKAFVRKVVDKIKSVLCSIFNWIREHPDEFSKIVEYAVSIGVFSGLKAWNRRRLKKKDQDRDDRMIYDRRTDTWSEAKRKLKYKEQSALEDYYRAGGKKSDWLYRKGLLKR